MIRAVQINRTSLTPQKRKQLITAFNGALTDVEMAIKDRDYKKIGAHPFANILRMIESAGLLKEVIVDCRRLYTEHSEFILSNKLSWLNYNLGEPNFRITLINMVLYGTSYPARFLVAKKQEEALQIRNASSAGNKVKEKRAIERKFKIQELITKYTLPTLRNEGVNSLPRRSYLGVIKQHLNMTDVSDKTIRNDLRSLGHRLDKEK